MNEINDATLQAKHGDHIGLDETSIHISQTKTPPFCIITFDRSKHLYPLC
jgi:hypothetical protein